MTNNFGSLICKQYLCKLLTWSSLSYPRGAATLGQCHFVFSGAGFLSLMWRGQFCPQPPFRRLPWPLRVPKAPAESRLQPGPGCPTIPADRMRSFFNFENIFISLYFNRLQPKWRCRRTGLFHPSLLSSNRRQATAPRHVRAPQSLLSFVATKRCN